MLEGLVGQAAAVAVLRRAQQSQRVVAAYLFVGPPGVGKSTAARFWATELMQLDAPACRRALADEHPDLRVVKPSQDGGNLSVQEVREGLLPWSRFAPFEASRAVVVLPHADRLLPRQHAEAANALLKAIEEPRAGVHWLLTTERPGELLPTLRSRCQVVRFSALDRLAIEQLLAADPAAQALAPAERPLVAALAQGNIGRALRLSADGAATACLAAVQRFDAALGGNGLDAFALAEQWAKADDLQERLLACRLWYRDVACLAAGLPPQHLHLPSQAEALIACAARLGSVAASVAEQIAGVIEGLAANANPQMALEALLSRQYSS